MMQTGLIISIFTELMEQWIWAGAFYLSPSRIFIIQLFFLAIFIHFWKHKTAAPGKGTREYTLAVMILLGINILSAWQSDLFGYSLKRVLNATSLYILPILVCFYLRANEIAGDKSNLLKSTGRIIVYSGLAVALFGLLQAATGWLQHSSEMRPLLGIPVRRINSLFPDPNFLAYFLIFPLGLVAIGGEATIGIRSTTLKWFIASVIILNIILTGSRGGQLMIVAATGSYLLFLVLKNKPRTLMAVEISAVVLFPLTLIIFSRLGFEYLWQHMATYDNATDSAFSRVLAWYAGIEIYIRSPWLGVGPGNFVTQDKGIYLPYNYVAPWIAARISALAGHSNVLEALVETGPFGLIAYFWMQLCVYKSLLRAQAKKTEFAIYRSLYFAAAIGNSVITYYPIFLMLLIGILLYLTEEHINHDSTIENKKFI